MNQLAIAASFQQDNAVQQILHVPPVQLQDENLTTDLDKSLSDLYSRSDLVSPYDELISNYLTRVSDIIAEHYRNHSWQDILEASMIQTGPLHFCSYGYIARRHFRSAGARNNASVVDLDCLVTEQGCNLTATPDNSGTFSLHIACLKGQLDVVKCCIAEANSRDRHGYTPLHYASQGGYLIVVQYLITEQGHTINTPSYNGTFPIHMAFLGGHMNIIQYLINKQGCDPKISSKPLRSVCTCIGGHLNGTKCIGSNSGLTSLHYASEGGHLNIIKYLITELGCDPNTQSYDGSLPLHRACLGGCLNVIKYFIERRNFNPSSQDHQGRTPLHYAAEGGHIDIIKYLINERSCDPKTPSNAGTLPLHLACLEGHLHVIKYFIKKCHPIATCRNLNGLTPLHFASQGGQLDLIQYLITELGCDPNTASYDGSLPLHLACLGGHLNAAKYFIKGRMVCRNPDQLLFGLFSELCMHGDGDATNFPEIKLQNCDKNSRTKNDSTPLHYAAERGHMSIIKFLITELGCDPLTQNDNGDLPLHIACLNGHLKATKYFITEQKCDPSSQNKHGFTPLHYAAKYGRMNVIQCLITELGCDPKVQDNLGNHPLHIACINGNLNATKYFIKKKCDPNSRNENGCTPLHCAAQFGHMAIIQYLVTCVKSCDSSVVDKEGKNILHLASCYGHPLVVEWLLHLGQFDILATDKLGQTCVDLAGHENKTRFEMLELFKPFVKSSNEFPIHTFSKTVIVGSSASGKTTLVRVITEQARAYFKYGSVGEVKPNSGAGIVISQIQSKETGKMVLYDLAGHAEYHSSHSAVMEIVIQQSPATFIIMVDLTNTDDKVKQQLHYWFNFIDSVTSKTENKSCLIVVGSHSDELKKKKIKSKSIVIDEFLQSLRTVKSQDFIGFVTMDCRKVSSKNTKTFIGMLHKSHQTIIARIPSMSYYCHLLYSFFKLNPETAVFTLSNLLHKIPISLKQLCPTIQSSEQEFFVDLLTALSDKGLIIFLANEKKLDASWIVVDIEAVTNEINGILFASKDFHKIASNTGIVRSSALKQLFPNYSIEMLAGLLQTIDLCHRVDLSDITTNFDSIGQSNEKDFLLFFPCFLTFEANFSVSDEYFSFGWCLCCREPDHQFFTSRFLHVLLLRLAYRSTTLVVTGDIGKKLAKKETTCDIWNNGICWDNREGIKTVVELVDFNRRVVVFMSTKKETRPMKYIRHRSTVIGLIVDLQRELCPNMQTTQYLISQGIFRDTPFEDEYPPDSALFPMENVTESMFLDDPYILSCTNKTHELFSTKDVLNLEPYYQLRNSSVCVLLNSSNADEPVAQYLLDEVRIACQADDLEQQTYFSLRKFVDQLSIFSGINPIAVSKLDRRAILAAEEHIVNNKVIIDLSEIPDGQIDPSLLPKLMDVLVPIVEWSNFGIYLGLAEYSLDAIDKEERGEIENCKIKMLIKWLNAAKDTTKNHLHLSLLKYKKSHPTKNIHIIFSRNDPHIQAVLHLEATADSLPVTEEHPPENEQKITKKEFPSNIHQRCKPVARVNYNGVGRSQRNYLMWSSWLILVVCIVVAAVWDWINYSEKFSKQTNMPLKCELIPTWTRTGEELLIIPWTLVFLVFALYCFKKMISHHC